MKDTDVKQDEITLSEVLTGRPAVAKPTATAQRSNIQDWLRKDHERNELKRDVEQLQRDIGRVEMFLVIGIAFIALVLGMQLLLLGTGV